MTLEERKKQQELVQVEITAQKLAITKTLLLADRKRAADVLLVLHYQLSRTTSSIKVK